MPVLIGLIGAKLSGKKAVANHLVSQYGFVRMAFTDKLKHAISMLFNVPLVNFEDESLKDIPHSNLNKDYLTQSTAPDACVMLMDYVFNDLFGYSDPVLAGNLFSNLPANCSPRMAMERIGIKGFRGVRKTVWSDYLERKVMSSLRNGRNVVVPAIRFNDEIAMLRRCGGIAVGIERRAHPREYYGGRVYAGDTSVNSLLQQAHFYIKGATDYDALIEQMGGLSLASESYSA